MNTPRTYPDPDQHMAGPFYPRPAAPRPLQPALSHEDQTLANSLTHEMNGHEFRENSVVQGAEPNPELSYDNSKIKRTKVSRACDECRKTKVRCDAATSTSAGSVMDRCTNCARKNVSCQFNRLPQKRGPSKGYIKELAERVHQVESHVGLQGRSFDASSPPEGYDYSPTNSLPGSRKRTHSQFEGNPFGSRHSLGGFTLGQTERARPRDSIALAPDEKFDDVLDERAEMRQPFWMNWKADTAVAEPGPPNDWDNKELFESYMSMVHPHLSVLPPYDVFKRHVSVSPQVGALEYVISQALGRKVTGFASERELEDFVLDKSKQRPKSLSSSIVWLWIYAFMILNADADLERLVGVGRVQKSALIELAYATAATLPADESVARVMCCVGVLARLYALGTGSRDEVDDRPAGVTGVTGETALLSDLSNIFSLLAESAATPTFRVPKLAMFAKYDAVTKDSANAVLARYDLPLAAQVKAFILLLLARQNRGNDPELIKAEVERLLDVLDADDNGPLAKPMETHLWIVAVITVLELIENEDYYLEPGRQALEKLRPSLKRIQARAAARMQSSATGGSPGQLHWAEVLVEKMDRALAEFGARPSEARRAVSSQVFTGLSGSQPTLAANSVVSRGTKYVCYNFAQMSHQGHLVALGLGYVTKRLKPSR